MIQWVGRCDYLPAYYLNKFDDTSTSISNRTFRKYLGKELYSEFENSLGYDRFLRLSKDYHVSYAKGTWKNKKAICCFWSSFHHIWIIERNKND